MNSSGSSSNNSYTLKSYLSQVESSIQNKNARKLQKLLMINHAKARARAEFPEPSVFDLYNLNKFGPVITHHLQVLKSAYITHSSASCFENMNLQCSNLVKASEQIEGNWIMPVILSCFGDLIALYKVATDRAPEDLDMIIADSEFDDWGGGGNSNTTASKKKVSKLEELINTLKMGFNLSNNDKTLDVKLSKRNDVYFFLANLIKYYFKMGKIALAKSAINSVKAGNKTLPNMTANASTSANAITYLYYQALVSLDDGQYVESEDALNRAMDLIANHTDKSSKQLQSLLKILIPLKLYNKGKIPHESVWQRFPDLKLMYRDNFLDAILRGDLYKYERCMEKFQLVLLKNHLYILMELLRQFVQLKVVHKTYKITSELQTGEKSTPFSAFKVALELSLCPSQKEEEGGGKEKGDQENGGTGNGIGNADNKDEEDNVMSYSRHISDYEVESIVCNLITQGYIRGYVSNTNRVVVFSKSLPFPKIADVKIE
ncbi:CSN12 [Candida theae]|uniref:CSN12 n=1 Tax=Candida theae TaxID=1198502 RepID=A0AAD5BA75_9ASCO|nr:CSN12 [Candida theae]KAI5949083.1 CSN12 [Candida theae]